MVIDTVDVQPADSKWNCQNNVYRRCVRRGEDAVSVCSHLHTICMRTDIHRKKVNCNKHWLLRRILHCVERTLANRGDAHRTRIANGWHKSENERDYFTYARSLARPSHYGHSSLHPHIPTAECSHVWMRARHDGKMVYRLMAVGKMGSRNFNYLPQSAHLRLQNWFDEFLRFHYYGCSSSSSSLPAHIPLCRIKSNEIEWAACRRASNARTSSPQSTEAIAYT